MILEENITLTHEICINIREDYIGKGYIQEAIKLLTNYAIQTYDMDYAIWKANKANIVSRNITNSWMLSLFWKKQRWSSGALIMTEDILYIRTYKILL